MLTIELAGASGQQAYLSNVLLQNKPTRGEEQETEKIICSSTKKPQMIMIFNAI